MLWLHLLTSLSWIGSCTHAVATQVRVSRRLHGNVQVQHMELCAAQRALALFQVLGNLHNYDEARCEPDEQDRFAALLAECLAPAGASGVWRVSACLGTHGSARAQTQHVLVSRAPVPAMAPGIVASLFWHVPEQNVLCAGTLHMY